MVFSTISYAVLFKAYGAETDLVVDDDPAICNDLTGDPFCTIQAAIHAAVAQGGGSIQVQEGFYEESVVIDISDVVLDVFSLVLQGPGGETTTLNPSESDCIMITNAAGTTVDISVSGFNMEEYYEGILLSCFVYSRWF